MSDKSAVTFFDKETEGKVEFQKPTLPGPVKLYISFLTVKDGIENEFHRVATEDDKAKYKHEFAAYEAAKEEK